MPTAQAAQREPPLSDAPLTALARRLFQTRRATGALAAPLSLEDQVAQAHPDASPTKWHLAHTTWFFETFVLVPHLNGYRVFDPAFNYCFNSYYEAHGERQPRADRGLLTRPSLSEVQAYRGHVDAALDALLAMRGAEDPRLAALLRLGIAHEEQHQELLLTDILALFAAQPLRPAYRKKPPAASIPEIPSPESPSWTNFAEGLYLVGSDSGAFAFDNETPPHQVWLQPFKLANRLVTNGEWLAFIEVGGYRQSSLWLSEGRDAALRADWQAPLYWEKRDGQWLQMTLWGLMPVDLAAPVSHVSFYEAEAFARFAGKRLPRENEWEVAAAAQRVAGNLLESDALRPLPAPSTSGLSQMFGDVWEWTQSDYAPYPGYRMPDGAIGEYNGKFMCNQRILRGGSCATPIAHMRAAYRNFFHPHQRWQFSGVRLAEDA